MDDAFTLLRRATDLLPEGTRAENGVTVDDVRDCQRHQERELVLDLLMEIADEQAGFFAVLVAPAGTQPAR
jgi:hypothetical protein